MCDTRDRAAAFPGSSPQRELPPVPGGVRGREGPRPCGGPGALRRVCRGDGALVPMGLGLGVDWAWAWACGQAWDGMSWAGPGPGPGPRPGPRPPESPTLKCILNTLLPGWLSAFCPHSAPLQAQASGSSSGGVRGPARWLLHFNCLTALCMRVAVHRA